MTCHACSQPLAWWEEWFWNVEAWCHRCEYMYVIHKRCMTGNWNFPSFLCAEEPKRALADPEEQEKRP